MKSVSDFSEVNDEEQLVDTLFSEGAIFSIKNGKTDKKSKIINVATRQFADALKENSIQIDQLIAREDFIGQINTAFVTDGWLFHIPENTKLTVPIELQNIQMGGQSHIFQT